MVKLVCCKSLPDVLAWPLIAASALRCAAAMQFDSLSAAAAHMGMDAAVLQQDVEQYNAAAAGNKDALGKQYFPTTIDAEGVVWVGQITPVVHYTMGGLKVNEQAQVCGLLADLLANRLAVYFTTNPQQQHDSATGQQLPSTGQKYTCVLTCCLTKGRQPDELDYTWARKEAMQSCHVYLCFADLVAAVSV